MNKKQFIAEVAEKTEMSKKDAEASVTSIIDTVTRTLRKGEKYSWWDLVPLKFKIGPHGWAATSEPRSSFPSPPPEFRYSRLVRI